jgi:hypothetical protein
MADGTLRMAVLIDYQNIHLTARDVFAPVGASAKDTLVHPVRFADQLCERRAALQTSYPRLPAQEKGIDVMLALDLVRMAQERTFDIVVLASHDTDLEPALEIARGSGVKAETAGWDSAKRLPPHA